MKENDHGPIEAEHVMTMNTLAHFLDKDVFNPDGQKKTGFVLLAFSFDKSEGSRMNYISNAERSGIVTALEELIANFKAQGL